MSIIILLIIKVDLSDVLLNELKVGFVERSFSVEKFLVFLAVIRRENKLEFVPTLDFLLYVFYVCLLLLC